MMKKFRACELATASSLKTNKKGVLSSGFSLIELLVALVIGLLVALAASQVFLSISRIEGRAQVSSDRQESLRFFYDSLAFDIRNATTLSYSSDSQKLILQFAGFVSDNVCTSASSGFTKIYHYIDGEYGLGVYLENVCSLDPAAASEGQELLVPGEVANNLEFAFLEDLYGVKATISLSDPQSRLPDEELSFYIANRNTGANVWDVD